MAFKKLSKRIKRLDLCDIGCIKWSSILFGAIVGAYIAGFVKHYLAVIVVVTIALAIRPMVKFLKK